MSLIDDIKRDREAGTASPWRIVHADADNTMIPGDDEWQLVGSDGEVVLERKAYYPEITSNQADWLRFERIPRMEAALLAAEELADKLSALEDFDDYEQLSAVDAALAAYRKATGAAE